jgi:hypothetical protein
MKALILLPIYGYPFAGFGRVVSAMTHSLQKQDILVHLGVFGTPYDSIWPIEEFGLPPDKIFKAFPLDYQKDKDWQVSWSPFFTSFISSITI